MNVGPQIFLLIEGFLLGVVDRLGIGAARRLFEKQTKQDPLFKNVSLSAHGFDRAEEPDGGLGGDQESLSNQDGQALSVVLERIYSDYADLLGAEIAERDLEVALKKIEPSWPNDLYLEILRKLPPGVLEKEKIKVLSRAELEALVGERTQALQEAKQFLEQRVVERTRNLQAEKNKIKSILYSIHDGVVVTDRQRRIQLFSKAAQKLLGLGEAEVLGKMVGEVLSFSQKEKEIRPEDFCPIRTVSKDLILYEADLETKGKNGETLYLRVVSSAIAEGEATDVGCILTLHDETAEQELELMKLDFVSLAAHELRTPMTSIRGYLELLKAEAWPRLSSDEKTFVERSLLSCRQLDSLINNLLNTSRIEQGILKLNLEKADLREVILESIETLKPSALAKNIRLEFSAQAELLSPVEIDRFRLSEVLFNLLTNAISYTASGGVVRISAEMSSGQVVVRVVDNGQGIPAGALPHLFTKFFRVAGPLAAGSKGTGLGLFISKSIIDLHHGQIFVKSEFGQGSTFGFSLPVAQSKT